MNSGGVGGVGVQGGKGIWGTRVTCVTETATWSIGRKKRIQTVTEKLCKPEQVYNTIGITLIYEKYINTMLDEL